MKLNNTIKRFILIIILAIIFMGCKKASYDETYYKPGMKLSKYEDAMLLYADEKKKILYYSTRYGNSSLAGKSIILDSADVILRIYKGYKN